MNTRTIVPLGLLLVGALAASGCGKQIGDACQTSVDCDPNGTRSCDLSQPGGYCTVPGCDETSCPDGSFCIRYFPAQFLTKPCNPACAAIPGGACTPTCTDAAGCSPPACPADCPDGLTKESICTADNADPMLPPSPDPNQICLQSGLCARRDSEQRACAKACTDNSDCRGGYECRLAGQHGSMLLSSSPTATAHFCAPVGSP